MSIPRTGQLGAAALGSLWLGAPTIWSAEPVIAQRAQSALTDASLSSALAAVQSQSELSGLHPVARLTSARPRSSLSVETPRGGVE